MKRVAAILSLTLILLFSCKKDKLDNQNNEPLAGKWRLIETLADPGNGSGKWTKVSDNKTYFILKANGAVEGNFFPHYTNYTIKDSIIFAVNKDGQQEQNFTYNIENDILIISPAGPNMCIEACGSKFRKED